jgi:hypothetical protein
MQSPPFDGNAPPAVNLLEQWITEFRADVGSLTRLLSIGISPRRRERLGRLHRDWLNRLESLPYGGLDRTGQYDWHLFHGHLRRELRLLETRERHDGRILPYLPFAQTIIEMEEARRRLEPVDPERSATLLGEIERRTLDATAALADFAGSKSDAERAAQEARRLADHLGDWFRFSKGYDPLFTWWASAPYEAADRAIRGYADALRERIVGVRPDDPDAIVGDPIGRDALLDDLEFERIPYTPEELIEIGDREYAWCEREMIRAAGEIGFGADWRAAVEHVKSLHEAPGRQTALVRDLAREAIAYLEDHDLLTVPDLAKETWRMEMMSRERQRIAPFFLGGETIIVSFPTDEMSHEEKRMSMRGNNRHFSRATVQHELIPGHHMQQFMNSRYRTYRAPFETPFWIEGWALHWEMLLWDLGFPDSPEDRIGMLFWRMHRCARISFSLRFHLGETSPEECVNFLVERVGHERANAEGEVRRSFNGSYPPLYQAAYMIGGLQFRALHRELVGSGKMTHREFHDRVLRENNVPVAILRKILLDEPVDRDSIEPWRFVESGRSDHAS